MASNALSRDERNQKRRARYAAAKNAALIAEVKRLARNARRRAAYAERTREQRERREERARRSKRLESIVGDVPTVVVSVFAVRGRHVTNMSPTRERVDAAVKKALGRGVTVTPKTLWATNFDFTAPLTHVQLARKLAKLAMLNIELDGGRVHIAAISSDGQFLPLSYAFDTMPESASMAIDEVLKHLLWYGRVSPTRVDEDE